MTFYTKEDIDQLIPLLKYSLERNARPIHSVGIGNSVGFEPKMIFYLRFLLSLYL